MRGPSGLLRWRRPAVNTAVFRLFLYSHVTLGFAVFAFGQTPERRTELQSKIESDDPNAWNCSQPNSLQVALKLIDAAPLPGQSGDRLSLVHAVNYLLSMEKADAITVLRAYTEVIPEYQIDKQADTLWPNNASEDEEFVSFLREQRICHIVPLLVQPVRRGHALPPREWFDHERHQWRGACGFPDLVVEEGVPFDVSGGYEFGGRVLSVRPLVEWVARHGEFREDPIRVTGVPIVAAENLYAKLTQPNVLDEIMKHIHGVNKNQFKRRLHKHLREQARERIHRSDSVKDSTATQ